MNINISKLRTLRLTLCREEQQTESANHSVYSDGENADLECSFGDFDEGCAISDITLTLAFDGHNCSIWLNLFIYVFTILILFCEENTFYMHDYRN